MSDLIDRNVLRARMYSEAFESDTDMQRWDSGCWIRYKLFENVVDNMPTVLTTPCWHRVEEKPVEDNRYLTWYFDGYCCVNSWSKHYGWIYDEEAIRYWMPIEPPKEDA